MRSLEDIEKKFMEITGVSADMSVFPMTEQDEHQITSDEDVEKYSFVTTPLWYVDQMLMKLNQDSSYKTKDRVYTDLCCGCGQFTIRILRMMKNSGIDDVSEWMRRHIRMVELNPASIASCIKIFGKEITMYIGDALKFRIEKETGLLFYDSYRQKWIHDDDFEKEIDDNFELDELTEIITRYLDKHSQESPFTQLLLDFS